MSNFEDYQYLDAVNHSAEADKFLSALVVMSTPCWLWSKSLAPNGYGKSSTYKDGATLFASAHRLSYEIHRGPVPPGLTIDHLCRNRSCVNPDHLEAVTQAVNNSRRTVENALKTHCPQGHEYNAENTYFRKDKPGRNCKVCARQRKEARRVSSQPSGG